MKISKFNIVIAVALIFFVFGSYKILQKKRLEGMENKKWMAIQVEREGVIRKKAKELNADYTWAKEFEKILNSSLVLMSYQIEKLWLIERPILFFGEIIDVKGEGEEMYMFKVKKSMHDPIILADLEIKINCEAKIAEKFLGYIDADRKEFDFEKPIVVFAKINTVVSEVRVEDGKSNEIKIGIGKCVDLLPSTENYSFNL